jgi:hypothetical protein
LPESTEKTTGWTGRRLLALVFALTLPLVTPRLRASDEIEYFAYLRSLAFDRDLDFENEYRHFYEQNPKGLQGFHRTFLELKDEVTGRRLNFGPMGSALLWSPFYLLAHLLVLLARGAGLTGVPADGLAWPYVAAAAYGSAVLGFLGLLVVHDALRRFLRVDDAPATASALALWLGSPLLYYTTLAPGFSHAPGLFAVALLLWLTLKEWAEPSPGLSRWALLGLLGGLCALVREQDGLFLVMPGLLLLERAVRAREWARGLRRGLVLGAAALLAFVPQLLAYKSLYGGFHPSPIVRQKMHYWSPHFLDVLFDPAHSLFFWSPVLLLATAGLARSAFTRERPYALALAGLLVQVWICGSIQTWSQNGAFGMRRFISATPCFALGLAPLAASALQRGRRLAVAAAVALFAWWNVSLMVQFGLRLMDRQKLEWPKVAVSQVTEVPRHLARAAYLFFTDRERLVREGVS